MRIARIVHELPWRVRLRVPPLVGHRAACDRIAQRLCDDGLADRVRIRPTTGSVLLESTETPIDAQRVRARVEELARGERDEQGRPIALPDAQPGPTRVARAVAHAFHDINRDVRDALDDRADLGTLLPVFFAVGGVTEVASTGKLPAPPWFNLFWWSIRSFMTFNLEAVVEEKKNGSADGAIDEEALSAEEAFELET